MIERILKLLNKYGISGNKLSTDCKLSNSAITDWRNGKAKPSTDAIIKIANYFNVSTDYLLTGKEFEQKQEINEADAIYKELNNLDEFACAEWLGEGRGRIKAIKRIKQQKEA